MPSAPNQLTTTVWALSFEIESGGWVVDCPAARGQTATGNSAARTTNRKRKAGALVFMGLYRGDNPRPFYASPGEIASLAAQTITAGSGLVLGRRRRHTRWERESGADPKICPGSIGKEKLGHRRPGAGEQTGGGDPVLRQR